jgi:vancomycin resistance protein YoaR
MNKIPKFHVALLTLFLALGQVFFSVGSAQGFDLTLEDQTYPVDPATLSSFSEKFSLPQKNILQKSTTSQDLLLSYAGAKPNFEKNKNSQTYNYNLEKIYRYLKTLSAQTNRPVEEPLLEIQDGRAVKFSAPREGVSLNLYESTFQVLQSLQNNQTSAPLVADKQSPHSLLSSLNTLGINELVAKGESSFKGSPKNRIHNIKVGVEKMTGVIIKPGEEFSFNKYLGPVEEGYGFLPELVIKASGTVPELGGGLCQVSSTTFRAAMAAGLPITQRKNHAYAVQYYAPQGTDATIYPGVVDLKFINDTPAHILIWPHIENDYTLIFEFYGTKDQRKVTLQKPVQYDRKPDGSLKATWTRIVEKDDTASTSTFKSTYLPPELFHKQEQFVSATGTPSSSQTPN